MQNGLFQNNIYYWIFLNMGALMCKHYFKDALGTGGTVTTLCTAVYHNLLYT